MLQVAYPFAPVGPDAVGGAEQVLSALDRGLVAAGHRSIVLAAEGSEIAGEHVAIPRVPGQIGPADIAATHAALRNALAKAVAHHAPHLLHFHGVDVLDYLPPSGIPALITLHLPPAWYPPDLWRLARPDTWLHAVSASQHATCPPSPNLLPPLPNGIDVEALTLRIGKRDFALCLGRICPEKNQHQALDAGSCAGIAVLLGGQVFGHAAHEAYWHGQVVPRLMAGPHRFLGAVGLARKRRLLSAARCLVSASLAPETSSLVAMEALACGTPVVAFPSGALADIVEHGVTGFLVRDVAEMAQAMRAAARLDPEACRLAARTRFSGAAMVARYRAAYAALARRTVTHGAAS
ncbi:glycosyltransferase [Falsiroseomonas bella]|uniref:glycosyltransferase n=1 Tax=Falsiroseomonas bella TaxID=2184016 RepID=UPI0018EE5D04|nr:glycosyltransferase [Falsiroseomonas bella]